MTRLWPVRPFALDAGPKDSVRLREQAESIAAQWGFTLKTLGNPGDNTIRTAGIRKQIARALDANGYSASVIAWILNRDRTTVLYYLGRYRPHPGRTKRRKERL